MKTLKKLVALLMAVAMLSALCVSASAEGTKTFTINAAPTDYTGDTRTYNYYRIFNASLANPNDPSAGVVYYLDFPTDDLMKTALEGVVVGSINPVFTFEKSVDGSRWNVIVNPGLGTTDGEALSTALKAIVDANPTVFPASGSFASGAEQSVTPGYYLITSSLGTKMVLDTFQSQAINEKNVYPSNTKEVEVTTASIGQVVTYTVGVVIPETIAAHDIVVVDTISNSLTLDAENITVTGTASGAEVTGLTFTLKSTDTTTKQYQATIPAEKVLANKGQTLTLTYVATLNENAIINTDIPNSAHIEYDHFVTIDQTKNIKTHGFEVKKIKSADAAGKSATEILALSALDGAEFSLWTEATGGRQIYVKKNASDIYRADISVTVDSTNVPDPIAAGVAQIEGLAVGTYYLQEDVSPNGYNKLTARQPIAVSETTSPNGSDIAIQNSTGIELPSTGGIGTTIFYVVGIALALGAAVILVARRKAESEK